MEPQDAFVKVFGKKSEKEIMTKLYDEIGVEYEMVKHDNGDTFICVAGSEFYFDDTGKYEGVSVAHNDFF